MKNDKSLLQNLRLTVLLLLLIAGALLTTSQDVLAGVEKISITSDPGDDETYKIGEEIQVTVKFSGSVKVQVGTNAGLQVKIGSRVYSAFYRSGSGSTKLVFPVTPILAGSDSNDTDGIEIVANSLNGNIKGGVLFLNDENLTHSAYGPFSGHKVDSVKPTVSGVSISSSAGSDKTYKAGDKIQATVEFSEKVNVTGTPELTLKIGSSDKDASYKSGSGTANIVFEYTVASGDTDTSGIEIKANQLDLNSGTIKDIPGNEATLTHSALTPQSSHKVDTTAPTVSSVFISSDAGSDNIYKAGDKIQATVEFSEKVNVTGTPQVTLEIGSSDKTMDYKSGSGNVNLVFEYTVAAGDEDTDGIKIEANQLKLNGGTIKDIGGNAATLTHTELSADSHRVDGVAPEVSRIAITSTPNINNIYKINTKIRATVRFDEAVKVTGTPRLTLKIGTANRFASYKSGGSTANLVFEYTVAAGDEDTDGISIEANKLSLNGGTIKDIPGNAATLTHSALGTQSSHKVDAVIPTISSLGITSSSGDDDTYKTNDKIQVTVTFSENVTVTGTPQLTLKIGANDKTADSKSGTGTKQLVFEYTVVDGDTDTNGISIEANQLGLNGGTLTDSDDNHASLTHTALTHQSGHKVDTTRPTVSSLAITSSAGSDNTYKKDDKIRVTMTFSEAVTVGTTGGTPQLTLKIGTNDRTADYESGTGTVNLVFAYTVVAGDTDTDGIEIAANQLAYNGGTLTDIPGNEPSNLNHTALDTQTNHKVDTTPPTVNDDGIEITSTTAPYTSGEKIQVTVTFSEIVTVNTQNGTPQVTLKIGSASKSALYKSGSGTANLVFEYTVAVGDTDTDGIEIVANTLNGGLITDIPGTPATLTHDALGTQAHHKVDAVIPIIDTSGIAITSTAGSDKIYKAGDTIQATVRFSENVTVTGTPQVTLTIGTENKKALYKSGSGTANLVFEYTVAAGDTDTDGISIAKNTLTLNGGTIKDAADNTPPLKHPALPTQADHKVDTTAPTILTDGIAMTSSAGTDQTYKTGDTVQATVTFSEKVNVTGTPQLTLRVGTADKKANYKSGSGTTHLVFECTVTAGDVDTDGIGIAANQLTLRNETVTIKDVGGNPVILNHARLLAQADHKVDAIAPKIATNGVSITSTAGADNVYRMGETIQATVTFSEKVKVTGIPQLTLTIGTKNEKVNCKRGSGTTHLVFEYKTLDGDIDTDGISIAADQLDLNGSTIKDFVGNTATLTHAALIPQTNHKVDAIKPTVSNDGVVITSSAGNDETYKQGEKIEVTVTFSEKVTVTGTPTLTLTIGTKNKNADWTRGNGTAHLVFEYTVVTGDKDTDGIHINVNQLAVQLGAAIEDSVGNSAVLTHAALPTQTAHKVKALSADELEAPTVRSLAITSTPSTDKTYKAGEIIEATVTFSENVTVTGTPQLSLKFDSGEQAANYNRGSGTADLVFAYTVVAGDTDTNGIEIAANKLAYSGGTIKDTHNNAAVLTHSALPVQVDHKVSTASAMIASIQPRIIGSPAITSTGAPYGVGETIQATVTFTEKVTVGTTGGKPQLTLKIGTDRTATWTRGSGTTHLVFEYTVQSGDGTTVGISIAADQLSLNGGTIKDSDDNAAVLTHAALSAQTDHKVDTTSPSISTVAITSSPGTNGTYKKGDTIQATVTFDETVMVTGTPQLTLTFDNGNKTADWTSGSGTASLIFGYTVASGDVDTNGISIGANQLSRNGGTLTDVAGNAATLTHAAVAAPGAFGVQATIGAIPQTQHSTTGSHKVDGVSPSIATNGVAITSTPTGNYYNGGETIQATVTFDEKVKVTGTPQLTLRIGNVNRTVPYKSGNDSAALVFEYTAVAGDADMDGISIGANQLSGTLKDEAGNVADLTSPPLTTQSGHKVDATIPQIAANAISITSTAGSNNTYKAGEKIQITVPFTESVTVTGSPQLTLKIGPAYKNAAWTGGSGTASLVFEYTVQAGDVDEDGISIDANQLNSGTIADLAGNTADLKNTTLFTQPTHKVGATTTISLRGTTIVPTVSSVALTSTGPYGVWDNIQVNVTTTKPVTVTGSPTVTVVIGNTEKRASYQSGSGGAALVFQYTVDASDGDDPNGISVKANSLTGGTLKDAADNTLNPNHPALPDQGPTHRVDTTVPRVSSLAFTSTGPYSVGSAIQVTATISEPIPVTGAPTLTLLVGKTERTAGYLSGTGTTALVFGYTVTTADKDDTDGVSVKANSLKLKGGTMVDAAGNALKLTHSSIASGGDTQAVGITVSGISAVAFTSTGPYTVKDAITITVTTAEKVTVTGTPRIPIVIGKQTKYANYVSGTGTTALVFQYTVVAGDADTDGVEIPQNALEQDNGSAIKSAYQTDLSLSHPSVAADPKHIVDTSQPVITAVAFATDAPAVYTVGSTIEVLVTFAETGVQVNPDENGALPTLSLLFGSNADPDSRKKVLEASYKETRPGSTKLVFTYTVTAETPVDTDGVQIKDNSLRIPASATITDANGNAMAATRSEDGSAVVGIKPSSRISSRPILPSFAATGVIFNEFLNAKTDKQDWVELRNTTDSEVSLAGWKLHLSTRNGADTDVLDLPDTMFPAGAVLLLMNTAHKETHLERSQAYTYRYFKIPALRLRGTDFSLMLRDRSGVVVDAVSNSTATGAIPTGFERDEAYLRVEPTTPGYEVSAWQASGYQGGLGYDRKVPKATSLGTPGYLASVLVPQGETPPVNISEIMFTTGTSGNLPQWIELYNVSKTEVVTLQGWRLQVEIYDLGQQPTHRFLTLIFQKTLRILPNQTVLVVTKNGRNSQHFPEQRLYNLAEQNAEKLEQLGPTPELLNDLGYAIVLRDASGTKIDVAGNLDGENRTDDRPGWKLPNCITSNGFRSSIIRQYEAGVPLTGTHKSSWFRATEMRRKLVTYYGHPKDVGNPGWKKGGPLPVQLSSFKAERTEQGALLQWTTESELENAGFNVLRCESKTGTFTVVTPRMLQGAGTTSDRSSYRYVDTTAKAGVAYYYRLEEVSFSGVRQPVATRRLRGHVSAANRSLTTFGSLKTPDYQGNQGNHTNHW